MGRVWGSKAAGDKALQRPLAARQVNFLKEALARADLLRLRKGSDLPPVFLSVPGLLIIANVL